LILGWNWSRRRCRFWDSRSCQVAGHFHERLIVDAQAFFLFAMFLNRVEGRLGDDLFGLGSQGLKALEVNPRRPSGYAGGSNRRDCL
jgi:hypothetical protein